MGKIYLYLIMGVTTITYFTCQSTQTSRSINVPTVDSLQADRDKYIAIIKEQIKGRERLSVDSVFENLVVLGGFPAENLIPAMNAWSRALDVSCGHCHNTKNFSFDEKPAKRIAREMIEMGNMISARLKKIDGLSEKPIVNCITCHRGTLKPAYKMPATLN